MDDELEKLLAELAEQERQRLRRKSNQQSNLAARNDRFCVNHENNSYRAPRYARGHPFEIQTSQVDLFMQKMQNSEICEETSQSKNVLPYAIQHSKQHQHRYLSSPHANYHYATLIRPANFQIFSKYSQQCANPKDTNIRFESNFARQVLEMDRLHLDNGWTEYR